MIASFIKETHRGGKCRKAGGPYGQSCKNTSHTPGAMHLFPKDHGSSEMGKLRPETLC